MEGFEEELLLDSLATKWFLLLNSEREFGVHPVNVEREQLGEFHHLYNQLRIYPRRFFQYLRKEIETFDYVNA